MHFRVSGRIVVGPARTYERLGIQSTRLEDTSRLVPYALYREPSGRRGETREIISQRVSSPRPPGVISLWRVAGRWDLSSTVKALFRRRRPRRRKSQQLYGSLSDRDVDGKIAAKERNLRRHAAGHVLRVKRVIALGRSGTSVRYLGWLPVCVGVCRAAHDCIGEPYRAIEMEMQSFRVSPSLFRSRRKIASRYFTEDNNVSLLVLNIERPT